MGSLRQSQIWSEELKTNFGVATGYLERRDFSPQQHLSFSR